MNFDYLVFKDIVLFCFLRFKMVMEVYICGLFVNVGVYVIVIEVVGYGMVIIIVDDCSGYWSEGCQIIIFL